MKIALEVNNLKKGIKPSKNDIIIFDGKNWYVTTKKDLFGEYERMIDAKILELSTLIETLRSDNTAFKQNVSQQIVSMSDIIESVYKNNKE